MKQEEQMVNKKATVILDMPFDKADSQFMKNPEGKIFFVRIVDGQTMPFPVLSNGSIKFEPDQNELQRVSGQKVQLVHPCALGITKIKWV